MQYKIAQPIAPARWRAMAPPHLLLHHSLGNELHHLARDCRSIHISLFDLPPSYFRSFNLLFWLIVLRLFFNMVFDHAKEKMRHDENCESYGLE